ncbi:MAG: site-2 protease family protein [Myxococcales bacterium]|nr:site-2 protease family protein [Myxococcales bacterium]
MQIARPFGIPLRLHWSFAFLVLGIVGFAVLQVGVVPGVIGGLIAASSLVISVVLHEYGHALAARRYGIATHHITLYPFGGVAAIENIPEDPDQETVIALAGPAVNFALAAIGGWLWLASGHPVFWAFVLMNLLMGAFNLIPAFPMDGGRVLRSLLARRMGWLPASRLAVRIGRGFAWAFLALGVATMSWNWLVVGGFLHVALNAEYERLVALHWERSTGRPAPWTQRDEAAAAISAE